MTTKKQYVKPTVLVVKMKRTTQLLQGSPGNWGGDNSGNPYDLG